MSTDSTETVTNDSTQEDGSHIDVVMSVESVQFSGSGVSVTATRQQAIGDSGESTWLFMPQQIAMQYGAPVSPLNPGRNIVATSESERDQIAYSLIALLSDYRDQSVKAQSGFIRRMEEMFADGSAGETGTA